MILWILSFTLLISASMAEVGKISKTLGTGNAYLMRGKDKISLVQDSLIEQGDEIFTEDCVLQLYLYPTTQINLAKNSHIKIIESFIVGEGSKEKSTSVISFIKGLIRLQVAKDENLEIDQKVVADGVIFGVRGTEFEVSNENDDFDLDVIEGEVEVSSPYVQTFVPEMVKANEGFRFNKKARNFQRRKFRIKFANNPGFSKREDIRQMWQQKRAAKRLKRHQRAKSGSRRERSRK
jgi:hypothetical protein